MPLSPGVRLGPYEILDAIGAGGMGEVYRAKDKRLDRTVAIKILPAHLSSDPLSKQRFEREAKTISSLNHPHICVLYDVGSQDGVDYLVMECVEGETLAKRYGHIRPEVQWIALSGIATDEIQLPVHEIDNQGEDAIESSLLN
jgi:serine/threonine protein kinase